MSTLGNNLFYLRKNRFSNNVKFVDETYNSFDFNGNLKSDKIEKLQFTNYLSSNRCKKYFLLLDICKKLSNNYNTINKMFIPDEFDSERHNSKRVFDIMDVVNQIKIDKKKVIFKFKCKDDNEIQFYVAKEETVLRLYLIDIYHIVIEAMNKKIGKADRIKIYHSREKCSYNMSEILTHLRGRSSLGKKKTTKFNLVVFSYFFGGTGS